MVIPVLMGRVQMHARMHVRSLARMLVYPMEGWGEGGGPATRHAAIHHVQGAFVV